MDGLCFGKLCPTVTPRSCSHELGPWLSQIQNHSAERVLGFSTPFYWVQHGSHSLEHNGLPKMGMGPNGATQTHRHAIGSGKSCFSCWHPKYSEVSTHVGEGHPCLPTRHSAPLGLCFGAFKKQSRAGCFIAPHLPPASISLGDAAVKDRTSAHLPRSKGLQCQATS